MPKKFFRCGGKALSFVCLWVAVSWSSKLVPALQFAFPGGGRPTEETFDSSKDGVAPPSQQGPSMPFLGSTPGEEDEAKSQMIAMGVGVLAATAVAGVAATLGNSRNDESAMFRRYDDRSEGRGIAGMFGGGDDDRDYGTRFGGGRSFDFNDKRNSLFGNTGGSQKNFSDRLEDAIDEAGEKRQNGEASRGRFLESPGETVLRETRNDLCEDAASDSWNLKERVAQMFEGPYEQRERHVREKETDVLCEGYGVDRMKQAVAGACAGGITCHMPEIAAAIGTGALISEAKRLRMKHDGNKIVTDDAAVDPGLGSQHGPFGSGPDGSVSQFPGTHFQHGSPYGGGVHGHHSQWGPPGGSQFPGHPSQHPNRHHDSTG